MEHSDNKALEAHRQAMKVLMQTQGWEGMSFRAAQQNAYAKMRMATDDDATVRQLVALITKASYAQPSPADYVDMVCYQYVDLLLMGVATANLLAAEGGLVDDDFIEAFRSGLPDRINTKLEFSTYFDPDESKDLPVLNPTKALRKQGWIICYPTLFIVR